MCQTYVVPCQVLVVLCATAAYDVVLQVMVVVLCYFKTWSKFYGRIMLDFMLI